MPSGGPKCPGCGKLLTELRNPQVQQAWKARPVQEREHGRVHVPQGVPGQQTFVNIVIFLVVTGILTWSFHIRRYKYLYPRHHGYLGSGFPNLMMISQKVGKICSPQKWPVQPPNYQRLVYMHLVSPENYSDIIVVMEKILHHLIGGSSHHLQVFIHPNCG